MDIWYEQNIMIWCIDQELVSTFADELSIIQLAHFTLSKAFKMCSCNKQWIDAKFLFDVQI